MTVPDHSRRNHPAFICFLVALSLLGAALVAHSIRRYGPGLSPDSVGYISIARNLVADGEYRNYGGGLSPEWPPLYPALTALAHKLAGVDALLAAGAINAFFHGLTVYAAGLLLSRVCRNSPLPALLGTVAIAISPALLNVSVMAWTEPLFICCTALYLLALHDLLAGAQSPRQVALVTLFAALAALTRYIGVVLIPVGALILLIFYAGKPVKKLLASGLFALGAALPILGWMWRNHQRTGTFMGSRAPSSFSLSDNWGFTVETLRDWFLPEEVVPLRWGLAVLVGLLGYLLWAFIRRRVEAPRSRAAYALPAFLLIIAYLAFLIISSTTTAYDKISNRLVVPAFVPLVVVLMVGWDLLAARWGGRAGRIVAALALVVAFLPWFLYMREDATRAVKSWALNGAGGYNTRRWRQSPLIAQLDGPSAPEFGRVYTNGPDVLYILTPVEGGVFSPRKGHYNSALQVTAKPSMQLPAHLIWFNNIGRAYLHTVEELGAYYDLKVVLRASDGAVYAVQEKR